MPFYRYECADCRSEFRILRRDEDAALATCPHCGSRETRRLLPRIGVIYKGRGYYSTDYRNARSGSASRSEAKEPAPASED